ncbi:general transcription factor 3C polypeptide 1 [Triplophysa dalaica]|uniref:general transcription factor 3C polypeptide 1 n=1 Tax=Triplophysa dalaica TaxID=1582913 RepID=UPI0024DF4993|nr:general transcription factor 3C polypeptide 1 [Triplophysa dalaica]
MMMMDPLEALLDEVALEGLDGISLQTLWMRLRTRQPEFGLNLDSATQNFIWSCLSRTPEIRFWLLPEPRKHVTVHDRFVEVDRNTGIHEMRLPESEDPYPVSVVTDDPSGVQGSCVFYRERVDVTDDVRTSDLRTLVTLEQAQNQWAEKLVMVASQEVRSRALIGPEGNSELKLSDPTYCILERLARARWQGELQREMHTRIFRMDAGKMHYLRRTLDRNRLITIQSHVSRLASGAQQHSLLLLLPRFHVDRRSKYDILMGSVSNLLSEVPNKMMIMVKLRQQLRVSERTFKRVYQYMLAAKMVSLLRIPLKELDPDGGPFRTLRGTEVFVRCLKLLKAYRHKDVEEDEDDENEEDGEGPVKRSALAVPRVIERDMLSQAYDIVVSSGSRGISQSVLRGQLNIGRLEGRMVCRTLERNDMIKGFMEDVGRQRTTKYISKYFVEESKLNLQFTKELQRSQDLRGTHLARLGSDPPAPGASGGHITHIKQSKLSFQKRDAPIKKKSLRSPPAHTGKSSQKSQTERDPVSTDHAPVPTVSQSRSAEDTPLVVEEVLAVSEVKKAEVHETYRLLKRKNMIIEAVRCSKIIEGFYSLQRLLTEEERKDGVNTKVCKKSVMRLIRALSREGLLKLYRTIVIQDGIHKKVEFVVHPSVTPDDPLVKSAIDQIRMRMSSSVSAARVVSQAEKKKSSPQATKENKTSASSRPTQSNAPKKVSEKMGVKTLKSFKPVTVPGHGRTMGFQPKMPRLRIVHAFLWYMIYGHPLRRSSPTDPPLDNQSDPTKPAHDPQSSPTDPPLDNQSDPTKPAHDPQSSPTDPPLDNQSDPTKPAHDLQSSPTDPPLDNQSDPTKPAHDPQSSPTDPPLDNQSDPTKPAHDLQSSPTDPPLDNQSDPTKPAHDPQSSPTDPPLDNQSDPTKPAHDPQSSPTDQNNPSDPEADPQSSLTDPPPEGSGTDEQMEQRFKVYVNENNWKRFIPPIPLHKDFGFGWALVSDLLISLPLSIFMQIFQINYKVEGLEQYMNDPVKQHYLIRFLPADIKRQLLHKRKYIFSFHETLQRLCFMGLLQFGPIEKFMDKDQVFVFLKTKATIVDTTVCDPHYNMAIETIGPFERRRYVFKTPHDVEKYWFDLLCVCLNTPLGVTRGRSREAEESDVAMGIERCPRFLQSIQGSSSVVDDGFTPGNGQGAGGLDSILFSHLKRNWTWTSHLVKTLAQNTDVKDRQTVRLRNLLSKHPKPATQTHSNSTRTQSSAHPPAVVEEEVCVSRQPASRNEEVRGGRKLKRKRPKKDISKPTRKKKKGARVRKQYHAQDETDRRALLHMTKQRVTWTHEEDSLLMLCRVTSHFLNRKLKKPFVPWTVLRDVLHAEFELSCDKTSLSVSRRSRYIMKNPQTTLNYRICLAELYQDKELLAKFMNRTDDYNSPQVCEAEYKEFVSALRSKFSSSYGSNDVLIPDTREELFKKFKVFRIGDDTLERSKDVLNRHEDIHVLVLFNLIQSTLVLTNAQMKNYRPFQTFCLYTQYKEQVLSQAFQTCRRRGLVNRRRPMTFYGIKKYQALPFLPMSYQLSQHYYRFFTWRIPSSIFNEVYDLISTLRERGSRDRDNRFSFQKDPETQRDASRQQETQERIEEVEVQVEAEEDTRDMLQILMDSPGGVSASCLTLMTLGLLSVDVTIPQQIVIINSSMFDNDLLKSLSKALDDDEEEDEEEKKRRVEAKPPQASHTNYLLMRGYYTPALMRSQTHNSNTTDNIIINSCSVHIKLRETPKHTHFTPEAASFSACSSSAPECFPVSFTRVYGSTTLDLQMFVDRCVSALGYTPEDIQTVNDIIDAVQEEAEFGIDRQELCMSFIHLEEPENGRTRTLQQYIQDLVDGEQLVEVGALSHRLVCMNAASHWLLDSKQDDDKQTQHMSLKRGSAHEPTHATPPAKKSRPTESYFQSFSTNADVDQTVAKETAADEKEAGLVDPSHGRDEDGDEETAEQEKDRDGGGESVRFVGRPWRVVDGSLNSSVCKGMLECLLLHVISNPGIREPSVLQHYSQVLQPVAILDLLQVLVDLGCVRKRYTVHQHKASLFSRPRMGQVKGQTELSMRDDAMAFYEPTVDCTLRLAQVFPHQPNWNKWVQLCLRV